MLHLCYHSYTNITPGRLFQTFERQGEGVLSRVRATALEAVYFIQIT